MMTEILCWIGQLEDINSLKSQIEDNCKPLSVRNLLPLVGPNFP
jgi:hypothetical protein